MTIQEIQKEYKQKLRQLEEVESIGNPHLMKKLDAQLNKEYREFLSEFHLVSAKLSLLKKLCGKSQRLTKQSIKKKKATATIIRRAKAAAEEERV